MEGQALRCPQKQNSRTEPDPQSLPRSAYFDSASQVWVLSRYVDVQAALYEPNLCPVGPRGEGQIGAKERALQARTRSESLAALPAAKIAQWESEFEPLAQKIAAALPLSRPVDVVEEFARPWSLSLAVRVTGADSANAKRLATLAAKVSAATADPDRADLKTAAGAAGEELDEALKNGTQPMAGPAFVALSQTLPCLLANAWLVLLEHPVELECLRQNMELLPRAVEELLRTAGLVRELHRQAIADVNLGNVSIKSGERVRLMVDVANHDPEQFHEGRRVNFSRRAPVHFALGAGQHSCAAAALLRTATGIATKTFVDHFRPTTQAVPIEWHGGSGFRWPAPVYAQRRG